MFIKVPNKLKLEEELTQKEKIEINMIKKLVISYFNVVKKNLDDSVIKAIIAFLINKVIYFKEHHIPLFLVEK